MLGTPARAKSPLSGLSLAFDSSSLMKAATVRDGFVNVMTGIGTSRSKVSAGGYQSDRLLTFPELESLFESNDLAAVIVAKPVEDAMRSGFYLETGNDDPTDDQEQIAKVMAAWNELGLHDHVEDGACFGRLKGAAGFILGAKDNGSLSSQLKDEDAKGIDFVVDFDAEDLTPSTYYPDGTVETYTWNPAPQIGMGPDAQRVHETRLVMFPGAKTTARGRQRNRGWDQSVLQRVYNALKSFDSMFGSTDAMFADASQAVFKLQGLIQTLAESSGTGSADVQTRLQLMDMLRSSSKAIVLDAGDETGAGAEDFQVVDRDSLGGLNGVMQVYLIRLAAAARMPLTVLLGMAPSGQDATGESDLILHYNNVDIFRQRVLTPRVLRVVKLVAQGVGVDASKWTVCWPELARPKPLDVRTAENMAVTSAVALITSQALLPEEVALSLGQLSREGVAAIKIDVDSRKKRLVDALKELEDGELGEEEGVVPPTKQTERKTPSKAAKRQV